MTRREQKEPVTYQVLLRCYHFVYIGPDGNGDPPSITAWCPQCQKRQALMSAFPLARSYW